uniref:Uncharacterized protein n=1 Tax=Anguilla anguilla TaxID=7936 RepID=A0A0E9RA17_ANGAN
MFSLFQPLNHVCTVYKFGDNGVYFKQGIFTKSPGFQVGFKG